MHLCVAQAQCPVRQGVMHQLHLLELSFLVERVVLAFLLRRLCVWSKIYTSDLMYVMPTFWEGTPLLQYSFNHFLIMI